MISIQLLEKLDFCYIRIRQGFGTARLRLRYAYSSVDCDARTCHEKNYLSN